MNALPPFSVMERAVKDRDASFDGAFFTAVKTTGVFCRPSCPAKTPLPQNREYYPSARDAIFAGYRPCKRCRPMHTNGESPEWVVQLLQEVDQDPSSRFTDKQLRGLGVDPARVRRYFLKQYGMTFQVYCRGRRLGAALGRIRKGENLDTIALEHGYDSHSGFRDAFSRTFGQPPGKSRSSDCIVTTRLESPVGPLLVGACTNGICLLEFTDRRALETQFEVLRQRFGCAIVPGEHELLERMQSQLDEYFAGKRTEFDIPLSYPGTAFQSKVWDALRRIPYGKTISYEDLAREVGVPNGQRAVGRANGQNRIAIVIPCHRVINKNGSLGGYGGGLWRKTALLELEQHRLAQS